MPGSHGDEAGLVRGERDLSTSPKFFNINSTLRSLGRPSQIDSLVALVLIGACGRSERGGLVLWLILKLR